MPPDSIAVSTSQSVKRRYRIPPPSYRRGRKSCVPDWIWLEAVRTAQPVVEPRSRAKMVSLVGGFSLCCCASTIDIVTSSRFGTVGANAASGLGCGRSPEPRGFGPVTNFVAAERRRDLSIPSEICPRLGAGPSLLISLYKSKLFNIFNPSRRDGRSTPTRDPGAG